MLKKKCLIFCLILYLFSAQSFLWSLNFLISDNCNLLSSKQANSLKNKARELSSNYNCGIYIALVPDINQLTGEVSFTNIEEFAEYYFSEYCKGMGSSGDGLLLLLSMKERDYDILAHGDFGNKAFTDYGKSALSNSFLNYFSEDDWFSGFNSYLNKVEKYLERAEQGNPVDVNAKLKNNNYIPVIIMFLAFALFIAIIIIDSKRVNKKYGPETPLTAKQMKNFRQQNLNQNNINPGNMSGTHINSSGFSHHSGKF